MGNAELPRGLRESLISGRIHHAYLLSGPGRGPRDAALTFARALVCEGDPAAAPCGACSACRRSDPGDEPIALDGTGKKGPLLRHVGDHADLLWVERGEDDTRVRIGQVRALQAAFRLRGPEQGHRVGVLADAEWLNQEAQNALLRLLEEPPPATSLVLVTQSPAGMLATVRSRCQRVAFDAREPLAADDPDVQELLTRLEELPRLGVPQLLDWAEDYRGPRAIAAAGTNQLLGVATHWLHGRLCHAAEAGAQAGTLDGGLRAFSTLQSCRKALASATPTRRWWPSGPSSPCGRRASPRRHPPRLRAMTHFSLTTPIYYVNAEPHIGHTYTTVVSDALARFHRQVGEETFFLTGTDEHGDKIAEAAEKQGEEPEAFAARISALFRSTWDEIGISYDRFIRTTDEDHIRAVKHMLTVIHEKGDIDFREYEGLYCVGCERFLTDRDLENGLCKDHERAPEQRTESNYFFCMSRYFERLAEQLEAHPDWIRPERYRNEVLAMLREGSGLDDLCISRPKARLQWGIELPFDPDYVCYVWFDALVNYLAGLGYPDQPGWEERWAGVEHMIGKDILKPHGVFWPCMLMAADIPLYQHLNVHGYWNVDNRKVSKSLGNMISPHVMQEKYGFEPSATSCCAT